VSPEPGDDEPLLRATLRAPGGDEVEEALRERMGALFAAGYEEERDAAGVLWLSAYVVSEDALPDDLGPWSVEPVARDWETRWRTFHRGGPVGGRLWVGPPWERPAPGLLPVIIDPGRAFGTGSHPTTLACLELLLAVPPGGPVLDLGCGSGVLSIAAARLGFGPVVARDVDALAVGATRANATVNGVDVDVALGNVLRDPLPPAPLWLANILRRPLEELFARPDARPRRAILSGLLLSEAFTPSGYRETARVERDGWVALLVEPAP
jgi:ribosomal protein L11 methyltransferase